MTQALVKGSIADIAKQTGQSIAETFLNCDAVVIVDTSASMSASDNDPNRRSRYDRACGELAQLQSDLPGKIGVISFSDSAVFCPNGTPMNLSGSTDLAAALKYSKIADVPGAIRFIVISDGEPNSESEALKIAKKYHNKIDTIFIGPEGGAGREFLKRLAAASGGSHVTAAQVKGLASSVTKLLATA
jgi:Mg-chelatase subunit ChlD